MKKLPTRAQLIALVLVILGVVADQLSKIWVLANLPGRPRTIVEGALSFVYAENRNMAFGVGGFIPENVKAPLLIGLTSILAVVLLVMLLRANDWGTRASLVLVVSGAIGNIIDRVRLGFVVDFIYWHGGVTWPNFNLADSFICVGAGLMILLSFRHEGARASATTAKSETTAS